MVHSDPLKDFVNQSHSVAGIDVFSFYLISFFADLKSNAFLHFATSRCPNGLEPITFSKKKEGA